MAVPYAFANATTTQNLSYLDANFNYFGNAITVQATSTAMTIDSSGNVGIGTTSPTAGGKLDVNGVAYFGTADKLKLYSNNLLQNAGTLDIGTIGSAALIFDTANTERMRIDSFGDLLIGIASPSIANVNGYVFNAGGALNIYRTSGASQAMIGFGNNGSFVGDIRTSTTGTSYNTSSDYRLKENIRPLTTGLATIGALNPVSYDWISDKSKGEGFIAHELQSIIPLAVHGEKDAVDEDGNIKAQGVDYSKIVVHLVAALQEAVAKIDALETRIATLETK